MSYFGATDIPVLDFWRRLLGFQSQSGFCLILICGGECANILLSFCKHPIYKDFFFLLTCHVATLHKKEIWFPVDEFLNQFVKC